MRLRTLAGVCAYAQAENVTLRTGGAGTQVGRPKAGRPGRAAFACGKRTQNTIKTTTVSDGQGRTLWYGAVRPGRMHDQTAMRAEGIAGQFPALPTRESRGRRRLPGTCQRVPGQVSAPPRKPENLGEGAITGQTAGGRPSAASPPGGSPPDTQTPDCVNGAPCSAGQDAARTTPRHDYAETHCAIAGLVCDRAAKRAARHRPSTELVPAFPADC